MIGYGLDQTMDRFMDSLSVYDPVWDISLVGSFL
jgi:hypothetical protein